MKCVLIEVDYKGYYGRSALTEQEFEEQYRKERPDIPPATEEGDAYTTRPLVHLWYCLTEVGSERWNTFFTDLSWGLPESDVEGDNVAYIDYDECGELRTEVEAIAPMNEGQSM